MLGAGVSFDRLRTNGGGVALGAGSLGVAALEDEGDQDAYGDGKED